MVDQSADLVTKEFLRAELAEVNTRSAQLEQRLTGKIDALAVELNGKIDGLAVETAKGFTGVAESFRRQQSWMIGTVISVATVLVAVLGLLAKLIFFP